MKKECPDCKGTTWISVTVDGEKKCRRCNCYVNSEKERLIKDARIPIRYRDCSIGNFETGANPDLLRITDRIREFFYQFPGDRRGLLLLGPPGVGKTHLAVGILHYLIEDKNVRCIFYDFRELLNKIRSTYDKDAQLTEHAVIQPLLDAELLVLDELGAEKTSDWVRDVLMYILNFRYNMMKPTIITTNYLDEPRDQKDSKGSIKQRDKKEFFYKDHRYSKDETLEDRIGLRLRSRLYEMCETVVMHGLDFRQSECSEAFKKGIRSRLKPSLEESK